MKKYNTKKKHNWSYGKPAKVHCECIFKFICISLFRLTHQSYYILFPQFENFFFFRSTRGTTASKLGHDTKSSSRVLGLTLDCVLLHLYSDSNSDQANRPFIWWEKCGKYLVIREFNVIYRTWKLLRVLCFCCLSFPPFSCTITIPDKI